MLSKLCARLMVVLGLGFLFLAQASDPLEAKVLRLNVVADPAQMDPITYSEIVSGRILKAMYESFVDVTPEGKVVPALAERWEALKEGNGFRFFLRKGVKFHSGRTFAAKDVKYTLESLLTPGSKAGLGATYLGNVVGADDMKSGKAKELTGVKIVDDLTVDISFAKPDVLFPIYPIFFMDSGIVAEQGADWWTKVSAGTGPFKFKQWKRGVSVDLDPNPTYWDGAPKISGVAFLIVPTGDTALSQYDAGELDFVDVPEASFRRVLRDDRYKDQIIQVPRSQVRYLGMNQNLYPPFKDKKVREAISLSLDRPAMIKGLYGGAAFPANGLVTPGVPGFTPGRPEMKYDPERAKALMAEAGFAGGQGLPPIEIATTEAFKDEATYYADQLKRVIGLNASVKVSERATHIKAMNAGEVAFFPWAWTVDYPDAMSYLYSMWHGASPYNRPRWKNADYDKLIDEASTTAGDAKRYELYGRAEKIALDDWATVPLPTTAVIALRKPGVHAFTITPFGFSNFKDVQID